jgi:polyisoprenoid-binding protein YceI
VRGTIDAEIVDGRVARLSGGHIEVPVATLKSGNALEDAELQRRIDARRYPTIAGEVRRADAVDDEGRFRVEGEIIFHGVTQTVIGDVQASADGMRIVVDGEHVFDVREFGIKPPRILMLRVEPDVRVSIKLVAEPA